MLKQLTIKNYVLIDDLSISFDSGFSTITGETGAGKSILLGALSLLIGQRADTDVLLDKTSKCIIEAVFDIEQYAIQTFFQQNEIDYDAQTIIRREILETGRSRAYINDTPVNLSVLKELGDKLIDIHSQHQNSYLSDQVFQLKVIDIMAHNAALLSEYREQFRKYHDCKKQLVELTEKVEKDRAELEFLQYQFDELSRANLKAGEQEELENESIILSNAESIKTALHNIGQYLQAEENGIEVQMKEALNTAQKVKTIFHKAEGIATRLESMYVEMKDLSAETERYAEQVELDPERLTLVKERLDLLYSLNHKHKVATSDELIGLRDKIGERLANIQSFDEQLAQLHKQIEAFRDTLHGTSVKLRENRKSIAPSLENTVSQMLRQLGMPNAIFAVQFDELNDFQASGLDSVQFLFTANKQISAQDISKVASGGEISRTMLAVKSAIASSLAMPAIVFDEIDTGVSGEIADRMGAIMQAMSASMQVISITHLPQVAAKGKYQYKVFKTESSKATNTHIKRLTGEERITEIAKMLSGKDVSEAAITNAKVLLQS